MLCLSPGLNAQVRKQQKVHSRVTSLFVDGSSGNVDSVGIWRSLSDMDLSAMGKEACRANKGGTLEEDPEAEADLGGRCLITEKEETESSDDNTTQYSIHPPFDFPYFLLLQGYSHRQVSFFFWAIFYSVLSLQTVFFTDMFYTLHLMLLEYLLIVVPGFIYVNFFLEREQSNKALIL